MEELDASSLTHSQLITSHWVAGQERGGEMVMRERKTIREKSDLRWKSSRANRQLRKLRGEQKKGGGESRKRGNLPSNLFPFKV